MGKITLLVSREEMLHQAHNILQEKKYKIDEMKVIRTNESVVEARKSIASGATIIIARGLQSSLIKQYTSIPVAEIVITAQEMAILIVKAKKIVKKKRPIIAVVGFKNMFCDMAYFDMIYDIELRTYFASQGSELKSVVERAILEEADLIIGGDTAVEVATDEGVPSLFLSITEDSLRNAFSMAERMNYAMDANKRNNAQMEVILDYSFNGVINMDETGIIIAVNPWMEEMLGIKEKQMNGRSIAEFFPNIDQADMMEAIEEGKEYSFFTQINNSSAFAVLAPVIVDAHLDSIILTCHKMKKTYKTERDCGNKDYLKYAIALTQFADIIQNSKSMKECVHRAKLYALSENPIVIMGETGTEKWMLAQSIHNSSLHKEGPFLEISCAGMSEEMQRIGIFSETGVVFHANGGSLVIHDIGQMTLSNQYRLYCLVCNHVCNGIDRFQIKKLDVRVIVTTDVTIEILMSEGRLYKELYYLLSGLVITIPPLRKRKEDLKYKLEICMKEISEHYSKYHVLTSGAWECLMGYPWKGNFLQAESLCERVILMAKTRSIDEILINEILREMYPIDQSEETSTQVCESEEAKLIRDTLVKYGGNREKTAKELGISKATLWRHMKKFEIKMK